jgi:hypothetical protein
MKKAYAQQLGNKHSEPCIFHTVSIISSPKSRIKFGGGLGIIEIRYFNDF